MLQYFCISCLTYHGFKYQEMNAEMKADLSISNPNVFIVQQKQNNLTNHSNTFGEDCIQP